MMKGSLSNYFKEFVIKMEQIVLFLLNNTIV
jgi:hypothetical protein